MKDSHGHHCSNSVAQQEVPIFLFKQLIISPYDTEQGQYTW